MTTSIRECDASGEHDSDRPCNGAPATRERPLSWMQTASSALSAGVGIQTTAIRDRDLSRGSLFRFVAVGLILTGFFVGTILLAVALIVP